MRRVLFLINSLETGGAQRVFLDDAQALAESGWEVHFAILFDRGPITHDNTVFPIQELHFTRPFDLAGLSRLRAYIRTTGVTVVYSTLNEANLIARLMKLACPRLRIYTREANHAAMKGWRYVLADMLLGLLSRRIIVVSRAVGVSIRAYAPWLAGRMVVIYNGVPETHIAVPQRSAYTRMLFVGNLRAHKNVDILIKALAYLPMDYTLTIVGAGGLRSALEKIADASQVSSRVSFRGGVPHDQLPELYMGHDLFVLPSRFEGCPNVISEAQSYALPVVAFAIAGMEEFIEPGTGVIVATQTPEALASGIRAATASAPEAHHMGMVGLASVRKNRSSEAHFTALLHTLTS